MTGSWVPPADAGHVRPTFSGVSHLASGFTAGSLLFPADACKHPSGSYAYLHKAVAFVSVTNPFVCPVLHAPNMKDTRCRLLAPIQTEILGENFP